MNDVEGIVFSDEDVLRFHAGWLGVEDFDTWRQSPGGQNDADRESSGVNRLIRNGLAALFPGCRFERD